MSFINIPNLDASLNFSDITSALGYVPVNKAGDSMTGFLFLNADPTAPLHAATKEYVDSVASGLNAKAACKYATTANIVSLSGLITVDGPAVSAGDRILVKNQLTQSQNGIYIADPGPWTRATDLDTGTEAVSAFTFITSGSTNSSTGWVQLTPAPITIGVTSLVFTQFSGPGTYTADGQGIILSGNQFQLQLDGTTLSKSGLGLKVATGGISNNEINASASIAYSKLNLSNSIVNADINASAAIVYSKLSLSNSIVNADINASAAISRSKLAAGSANHVVINDGSGNFSSEANLAVSRGGTGTSSFTSNGILYGNGTSAIQVTAAGSANQVFRVPSGGNPPSFGSIDLASSAAVGSSILPIANGGTGSSTQNFVDLTTQQSISGAKILTPFTLTDAANIATDASLSNVFRVVLGGNRNLSAPTNPTNGQKVTWIFIQDTTGGRTLTFDAIFNFGTFQTLALSGGANKRDYMGAIYSSTTTSWNVVAYSTGF